VDRPFVVFSQPSLVIDKLGEPYRAPVSGGSSPSPATIRSDDPSVVEVRQDGAIVGTRNGRTTLRTLSGEDSTLEIEVRAVGEITIEPLRLEIEPGGSAPLAAVDVATGARLDRGATIWISDDPAVVSVRGGTAFAGAGPGAAHITARYGAAMATALVSVRARAAATLAVAPTVVRLRTGEVRAFQASDGAGR
jgi:hypothetical protein